MNNLLYMLHTTPIIDKITLASISEETRRDSTLAEICKMVKQGNTYMPMDASEEVKRFKAILPEITITGNDILLEK